MTTNLRSFRPGLVVILGLFMGGILQVGTASAQTGRLKDCVSVEAGTPAVVQEGRYNILCLRPSPGPFFVDCFAKDVPGPHTLVLYPYAIDGPGRQDVEISGDGAALALRGVARTDAHLFLSYDGPFDPIRDGYTLTCRW